MRGLCCLVMLTGLPTPATGQNVVIRGKVMFDDGTRPGREVYIESTCHERVKRETTVDGEGDFMFTMARSATLLPMGGFRNCDIRAVLPGYTSPLVHLAALVDGVTWETFINAGTIVLRRQARGPDETVSLNVLHPSKLSREAYERGLRAFRKKRWVEAEKQFTRAASEHARHDQAWYYLGLLRERRGDMIAANDAYWKTIEANPNFTRAYLRLAELATREGNWREAAAITRKGMERDPAGSPALYVLNAFANFNLGDLATAEKCAREAVRLDTTGELPQARRALGGILVRKGEFASAIEHLRVYLKLLPNAADKVPVLAELAEAERRAGRR